MSETKPKTSTGWGKWILAGGAVLALGVGVGVADWSRGGGGPGGWQQHGMGPGMGGGMGPGGPRGMARLCERDPLRFEGVARAFLKADLDLNAQQNAELDKMATALMPALKELRDEVCNNFAAGRTASAPERLERFAVVLRRAADTAEKSVAPAKSFYATLDDKQKARVDELTDRRRHHRRGGPGGEGQGPGPRGPGQPN